MYVTLTMLPLHVLMDFYDNKPDSNAKYGLLPNAHVYHVVMNVGSKKEERKIHKNMSVLTNPDMDKVAGRNIIALTYYGNISNYDEDTIFACTSRMQSLYA